jgi:hypothetical protein
MTPSGLMPTATVKTLTNVAKAVPCTEPALACDWARQGGERPPIHDERHSGRQTSGSSRPGRRDTHAWRSSADGARLQDRDHQRWTGMRRFSSSAQFKTTVK